MREINIKDGSEELLFHGATLDTVSFKDIISQGDDNEIFKNATLNNVTFDGQIKMPGDEAYAFENATLENVTFEDEIVAAKAFKGVQSV